MGSDKNKSLPAAAELRRRASEQLKTQAPAVGFSRTEDETQRLSHELQVHQIELEMQNEELLKTRVELETALGNYTDLYDFAPVGYLILDRDGTIRTANLTTVSLLNVELSRLIGQRFGLFVAVTDRPTFADFLEKILASQVKVSCEVDLDIEGDLSCSMQIEGLATASGQKCRIALIDVTERRYTEKFQDFLARTSSVTADSSFFKELARYLGESLAMDFVCIDRLEGDGLSARTVAVWCDGHFEDNVTYALQDTPCGDVVGKTICCFPTQVCQFFPDDQVLKDLRADSYVGVTLWSHDSRPIGLIAIIGRRPLRNRVLAENMLKLVAVRAAGELERLDAVEALRASEKRHRTILQTAIDGFWVMDKQGRLLEFNEAYCQMSGYSAQELLGMNAADLEAGDTDDEITAHICTFMEQGADRFEHRHRRKDGSIFDVEANIRPLPDNDGCLVGCVRDITERKRMEELTAHLASFPRMNPNPVIEVDSSGQITFFNPATLKILATLGMEKTDIAVFLPSDMEGILASCNSLNETNLYREVVIKDRTFGENISWIPKFQVARFYPLDITARKKEEVEKETTVEFLRLVNKTLKTDDLIKNAAAFFQETSGCEALGIRLKDGDDYPYHEARGFPPEFILAENSLCAKDATGDIIRDNIGNPVLACMCGNIVCGHFDPMKEFFSKGGSFWTNSTTKWLASTTEKDCKARTRNRCHGEGYESVALIPLSVGAERLGLIQLNDRRPGMFTAETIALWERLAGYLSIAMMKFRAENDVLGLNADLAARNLELKDLNKELAAFSYSVSHDLRAPLRAIDGFSKILLDKYHNLLDEKGGDYLQRVRSATLKMDQLIDAMLKLSRLSKGGMNITAVDLSHLAMDVAAELSKAQTGRQVSFAITEGLVAQCDQHLIRVVLDNLLGNAWKFTGKKEEAAIEFGSALINGTQTYFVRDNGAGFDMAYTDKLFGTFQRLHLEQDFPGTGIGLSLVQRIIHRHGGKVWAEGKVGKGATFYFTLTPMKGTAHTHD